MTKHRETMTTMQKWILGTDILNRRNWHQTTPCLVQFTWKWHDTTRHDLSATSSRRHRQVH